MVRSRSKPSAIIATAAARIMNRNFMLEPIIQRNMALIASAPIISARSLAVQLGAKEL